MKFQNKKSDIHKHINIYTISHIISVLNMDITCLYHIFESVLDEAFPYFLKIVIPDHANHCKHKKIEIKINSHRQM